MGTAFWTNLETVSQIAASIVTVIGIFFIAWQLSDTRRFTKAQLLNELEKESNKYSPVYAMTTGTWRLTPDFTPTAEDLHGIYDCLGFFERIKVLLDNRVIDLPTVDRLFGGRFFLLVNDLNVQKHVLCNDEEQDEWITVFALHKQWSEYRQSHGDQIPHTDTDLSMCGPDKYDGAVASFLASQSRKR